jgi:Xaa-Pro aminopeptidase
MTLKNAFLKKHRIAALQKRLRTWRVDACLIENPVDLFYLLGISLSQGSLLVTHKTADLFVDGRYVQMAQENSLIPVHLLEENKFLAFLKRKKLNVAFDSMSTSFARAKELQSYTQLKPIAEPLKQQRLIKDSQEISALKKSAQILKEGMHHVEQFLKEGISERDVAFELEFFCRRRGAEALSFESVIAFGSNSAMPHYRAQEAQLKRGDLVLIDAGVVFNHYHSDMTRVLFFGTPDPTLKRIYQIVKKAQKAALELCRAGTKIAELDAAARKVMKKEKVEEYFIHSLGHGIGLQTHEFPKIKLTGPDHNVHLQAGMVITIEPGLYFPGLGGIRHEDMILITKQGYQNLTR